MSSETDKLVLFAEDSANSAQVFGCRRIGVLISPAPADKDARELVLQTLDTPAITDEGTQTPQIIEYFTGRSPRNMLAVIAVSNSVEAPLLEIAGLFNEPLQEYASGVLQDQPTQVLLETFMDKHWTGA